MATSAFLIDGQTKLSVYIGGAGKQNFITKHDEKKLMVTYT